MTPSALPADAARTRRLSKTRDVQAAQVRLLYKNANVGVVVTVIAVAVLARLQWAVVAHQTILVWSAYMCAVSVARHILWRRYMRKAPPDAAMRWWGGAFAIGASLSGIGWGAGGVLMYAPADLTNQLFLVFVLGGMMLGAASLLAPRPEAFLAFIVPTGFAPAVRLILQANEAHLEMGLLAGLFTLATLLTTWQIHLTITSSLYLQFENQHLVDDLQAAKNETDALNRQLEDRVRERTAELRHSTEQLRAEIRQREQIEEELLRARKLESLGVFAGGIAHDFNNFLTIVQGNIELAKMRLDPGAPLHAILDETANACHRAAFLSSQLLTFAKGGAPVRRVVSVARLVMDAVHLARAGAQISIEVGIPEDLWCAEVDAGQIGQVLHNILLNARQAMPEDGIIEVHAENIVRRGALETDQRVRISIRDYGCGIPADILPRIFDPYFSTKSGGKGLGLATAYAIVAKHGGNLSVQSRAGEGAVFIIDLPASERQPEQEAPVVNQLQTGTERVLVMDDEEALRKLLEAVLTNIGYEVQTARDGAEAIALVESAKAAGRRFDVALLDLTVSGGMGGMQAAPRLKAIDPSLKLIVSSGYSDDPVMSAFHEYGFDDVLPKPWMVAQVSSVFRRLLVPDPDRRTT